ncbi:MAG: beta-lactamase family protein [Acetobacteraceae bacterium]|nr:beta-lactamase family protein [Acetobacteraceae bacterium]
MPYTSLAPELGAALSLLSARIEADLAMHVAPGLSIAVVHEQAMIWSEGFGQADLGTGAPATSDTVYAVGSITKLFTATLLMQLRDAGKLRLDDPVQDILPEVPVPRRHPGHPPITLRHLVSHTSGLAKDSPVGYWDSVEFPPVERLMSELANTEQPYPPGVQWKYSNLGIALLGYALSRVGGAAWEDAIAARIMAPLGMSASAPKLAAAQRAHLAKGYARPTGDWPPTLLAHQDLGGISAGGSMHATAPDMAKLVAAQFGDASPVLAGASVAEMHRPIWVAPDWSWGQGIGWRIRRTPQCDTRVEHGGGVHGFTCRVLVSVPDQLGVVVFTNGSDGNVGVDLTNHALDLLVPVARRIAARAAVKPAPMPVEWDRYLGRYRWVLGDMEIVRRDGQLVMLAPDGEGTETVALVPDGAHAFRLSGSQVRGELLRFVPDNAGAFSRAWVGPHPHDRI